MKAFSIAMICSAVCLVLCGFNCNSATVQSEFDAANRLYEQGKYAEASSAYEKLLAGGGSSEAVLFNAGNAAFKSGHLGKAVLFYRQAQLLEPSDADARRNLAAARAQARGGAYQIPWWERSVSFLGLNAWTILLMACLWAMLLIVAAILLQPKLKPRLARGIPIFAILTLFFGLGFFLRYSEFSKPTAIVTAGESDVRNGPLDEAQSVFKVRDGVEMSILDVKDDWFQVSDSSDRLGWIRKDQVAVFDASAGIPGKS